MIFIAVALLIRKYRKRKNHNQKGDAQQINKLRITIEMDVDIDKDQYPHLTIEDIEKSIVIQNSDAIDGFAKVLIMYLASPVRVM